MDEPSVDYLSYLLRLWRTGTSGEWQASLEAPVTGERVGFANLDALVNFLRTQTTTGTRPPYDEEGRGESDMPHLGA
jgi:hypothetical protein